VTYTVGGAGRTTQISDSNNNNYVGYSGSPATYTPGGAVVGLVNGYKSGFTGIVTSNQYNKRLEPAVLSAASPSQTIFSLSYGYVIGHDNGNVASIANGVRTDATASVTFAYDPLNRIQQANTTSSTGANCWGETYSIDPWGNLTNISGVQSMPHCNTESQGIPVGSNNQITGYCYDLAGNVLDMGACAAEVHSYVYDAEGELQSPPAIGSSNGQLAYTYYYDGDGNRSQKCNANPCTSGATGGTLYWRGVGGAVLSESDRSGNMKEEYIYFNGRRIARRDVGSGAIFYYFSDHLGSANVIVDSNGNVTRQTDFYPYGGVAYNSGSDPNRYKFTGKERDSESNLDSFGARYYASAMGRFMIPDWSAGPTAIPYAELPNPQSLNLYAYVGNNPLNRIDPLGHVERCLVGWGHCGPGMSNENNPNGAAPYQDLHSMGDRAAYQAYVTSVAQAGPSNTHSSGTGFFHRLWHGLGNLVRGRSWNYTPDLHEEVKTRIFFQVAGTYEPLSGFMAYVPSTGNLIVGGGVGNGEGAAGVVGISNDPEGYLRGWSGTGCGFVGVGACYGRPRGGGPDALMFGGGFGGWGGSYTWGQTVEQGGCNCYEPGTVKMGDAYFDDEAGTWSGVNH